MSCGGTVVASLGPMVCILCKAEKVKGHMGHCNLHTSSYSSCAKLMNASPRKSTSKTFPIILHSTVC
eukprot:2145868-Amphidinium_carterae.1